MKAMDLPKKYILEKNILILDRGSEATLAYAFPDALVTFTFSYGSRPQFANVPLRIFWMKGVEKLEDRKPPKLRYH